jgi:hypothetical protein
MKPVVERAPVSTTCSVDPNSSNCPPERCPGNTPSKILAIYAILLAMNVSAWLWAIVAFRLYSVLLGAAFLAYSFGFRHAVDADRRERP